MGGQQADGTVTRIGNKGHIAATIPVGGRPVAESIGLGQVWVADALGNLVISINPASNEVAATIAVGRQPLSLAAASDGIWVANAGDGTVSVIHRTHDWTVDSIQVGGRPVHVFLANTGAWVADESGRAVVRIARKSKSVTARIGVGGTPNWIKAYNDWDLFVSLSGPAQIVRIDPDQNRVFGPPIPCEAGARSLVDVAGSLWFADAAGTTLTAVNLDPTGQLLGSGILPAAPANAR